MKHLVKIMIAITAIISLQANAAKPQLDVQVSVAKAENGNVNAKHGKIVPMLKSEAAAAESSAAGAGAISCFPPKLRELKVKLS